MRFEAGPERGDETGDGARLGDRHPHHAARRVPEAAERGARSARPRDEGTNLGRQHGGAQHGLCRLEREVREPRAQRRAVGDGDGAETARLCELQRARPGVRHLLRDAGEPDHHRGAVARPLGQSAASSHLEPERRDLARHHAERGLGRGLDRTGGDHHRVLARRPRPDLEGRLDDHAERAERADVELREVVAGDVLDHAPAAADERAVGADHADAEQQVAHAALRGAERAREVRGDEAADRRRLGPRRIEG